MLLWMWMFNKDMGSINQVLAWVGIQGPDWLQSYFWAKPALMLMASWAGIGGVNMILYLAGLTSIPGELVEAARVDGAAQFQVFRRVIVPLLRPITTVVLSLIAINSLRNFDLVFAMTQGGPVRETETMPMLVWRILFRQHEQGLASAVSLILFAMTLVVIGGLTWWGRRGSYVD